MIKDTITVFWKEWQELLRQRGSLRSFLLGLLVPVVVFGVMLPLQAGTAWVHSAVSLSAWVYMPTVVVMTMMADSFAGERERHTLETLLSTRLSDQAILYGKIAAAVSYAMLLALIIVLVGLLTVNLSQWGAGWIWYSASVFGGGFAAAMLLSLLGSTVGVLVSLRAPTVRQATQTLSYIMLAVFFLPLIVIQILPRSVMIEIRSALAPIAINLEAIVVVASIGLLLVNAVLLSIARARFQRTKLTLD